MRDKYVTGETVRNRILQAIGEFQEIHNRPPNLNEIAAAVGYSKSAVHYHIKKLKAQGKIDYERYHTRTISLI